MRLPPSIPSLLLQPNYGIGEWALDLRKAIEVCYFVNIVTDSGIEETALSCVQSNPAIMKWLGSQKLLHNSRIS